MTVTFGPMTDVIRSARSNQDGNASRRKAARSVSLHAETEGREAERDVTLWRDVEKTASRFPTSFAARKETSAESSVAPRTLAGRTSAQTVIGSLVTAAIGTAKWSQATNALMEFVSPFVETVRLKAMRSVIRSRGALKTVNHFLGGSVTLNKSAAMRLMFPNVEMES